MQLEDLIESLPPATSDPTLRNPILSMRLHTGAFRFHPCRVEGSNRIKLLAPIELADLASAFPDLRIVANHVGGVLGIGLYRGKRDEVFSRWAASIKALAARPNVYVKLGGLGQGYTGLGFNDEAEPPSSVAARFRPYIQTCIEAFGASRSMFESNFPVDKLSYSYPVFWNACKLIAKGASNTEKAALFAGSAKRCYRLDRIV